MPAAGMHAAIMGGLRHVPMAALRNATSTDYYVEEHGGVRP